MSDPSPTPAPEIVEIHGIAANLHHDGWIREGAKCYVGHDTDPHSNILKRSVEVLIWKNGRWARKWVMVQKLYNARRARAFAPKDGALDRHMTRYDAPKGDDLIAAINGPRASGVDSALGA